MADCYCNIQAALAACIKTEVADLVAVEPYLIAWQTELPYATIEALGDPIPSKYYGGQTEEGFSRVRIFADQPIRAMELAELAREAVRCCKELTGVGNIRVADLSSPRIEKGDENDFVAIFRVTHHNMRSRLPCPAS